MKTFYLLTILFCDGMISTESYGEKEKAIARFCELENRTNVSFVYFHEAKLLAMTGL